MTVWAENDLTQVLEAYNNNIFFAELDYPAYLSDIEWAKMVQRAWLQNQLPVKIAADVIARAMSNAL